LFTAPKAPLIFIEAVARRLREVKDIGGPLNFQVVFAVELASIQTDFCDKIDERLKEFEKKNVAELVHLRLLDTNDRVGFDVLIVDEISAEICFPTTMAAETGLQKGIHFDQQPSLCHDLSTWFNSRVWDTAINYSEWKAHATLPRPTV
jgi:hypothetical protein